MGIGVWQLVLILAIVVVIFGLGKFPKMATDIASGIKNFKKGMKEGEVDAKSEDTAAISKDEAASAESTDNASEKKDA
jgi:sec-independent protein translocase protein TatA